MTEIRKLVIRNTETGATDVLVSSPAGTFAVPSGWELIGMLPELHDRLVAAAEADTHADP